MKKLTIKFSMNQFLESLNTDASFYRILDAKILDINDVAEKLT